MKIIPALLVFLFPILSQAEIRVETIENHPPTLQPITWQIDLKVVTGRERVYVEPEDFWTKVTKGSETDGFEVEARAIRFSGKTDAKSALIFGPMSEYTVSVVATSYNPLIPDEYRFSLYNIHYVEEDAKGGFEEREHELEITSPPFKLKASTVNTQGGPMIITALILLLAMILYSAYKRTSTD